MVNIMDETEAGLKKIEEKIKDLKALEEKRDSLTQEIRDHDAELLKQMAKLAVPVVKIIGLNMLKEGQTGHKRGDLRPGIFPAKDDHFREVCKSGTVRPDNPQMPVTDQFCVLSEEGKLFELNVQFRRFPYRFIS